MLCISHCVIIYEACRKSWDQADLLGMGMVILKGVSESRTDMTRKLFSI